MQNLVLLPVDDSTPSREAAATLGRFLKDRNGSQMLVFHCSQHMTSVYQEELFHTAEAPKLIAQAQEKQGKEVLESCREAIVSAGFPADKVQVKLKVDSLDPAQDILAEADKQKTETIAIGRRGRSKMETLLLGSVSGKVVQYARQKTVWIVDSSVSPSQKVLIGLEDHPECLSLVKYAAEWLAPIPDLHYTLSHLMPPQPPTFWDDGHILNAEEQKQRESQREQWRRGWVDRMERLLDEGRNILVSKGVPAAKVTTRIDTIAQGIAQDLLNDIEKNGYQVVVIGKKSFRQAKPFNLGSHANKVLFGVKKSILVIVDSPRSRS
jgi:nucleotide-binding universal stress UspA family protein